MDRDPYEVLGVPRTASDAEIRRAFWALAKKYHPDVSRDDPDAGRRFIEVRDAAERLLEPGRGPLHREPRTPRPSARPPTTAPKPPPAPPPVPVPRPIVIIQSFAVVAVLVAVLCGMLWATVNSPRQQANAIPANGTVVWKAAGYGLDDGWGINLAGNGARIQIVPGTSTDIEVTGGYLSANGHIALLPPGESLTYQHCVTAAQQASSQSEPLSEIMPGPHGSLCVTGGGGDLAAVQVTRDNGSRLVMNITVWEYV